MNNAALGQAFPDLIDLRLWLNIVGGEEA